jgi:hypothetical protein
MNLHTFYFCPLYKFANWIGHILRINCLLQQVIEGKIKGEIEVTGRRGRRRWKLLDDLKERREYSHLKEEALGRTMWRARFGRGFGSAVRQTAEWMNEWICYESTAFHHSVFLCRGQWKVAQQQYHQNALLRFQCNNVYSSAQHVILVNLLRNKSLNFFTVDKTGNARIT